MNSFMYRIIAAALVTAVSTLPTRSFAQSVDDAVVAQTRADLVSALAAAVSDARRFTVESVSLGMTVAELEDAMGLVSGTLCVTQTGTADAAGSTRLRREAVA